MRFNQLVDALEPKSDEQETMTLDKFLGLLSPSDKKELEKAEKESKEKSESETEPTGRKRKDESK
jgi:hypothetical protein